MISLHRAAAVCAALLLIGVSACAESQRLDRPGRDRGAQAAEDHGLPLETLRHDGLDRTFLIARPDRNTATGLYPVVIGLHGGGPGDAATAADVQRFHEIDAGEPLLVVYPNGIGAEWNDGRGETFTRHGDPTADDVGFLAALIDHLVRYEAADSSRIYMAGASNGAMMSHRAGCELAEKLAAIAPVIAPMPSNTARDCTPQRPLPVLMILGEEDPWVPFEGGTVAPLGRPSGTVLSADRTMALWAEANGCALRPQVRHDTRRPAGDGTRIRRETYWRCAADTVMIVIEGGGHTWPGADRGSGRAAQRLVGRNTSQLDATMEIWAFFQDQRR